MSIFIVGQKSVHDGHRTRRSDPFPRMNSRHHEVGVFVVVTALWVGADVKTEHVSALIRLAKVHHLANVLVKAANLVRPLVDLLIGVVRSVVEIVYVAYRLTDTPVSNSFALDQVLHVFDVDLGVYPLLP